MILSFCSALVTSYLNTVSSFILLNKSELQRSLPTLTSAIMRFCEHCTGIYSTKANVTFSKLPVKNTNLICKVKVASFKEKLSQIQNLQHLIASHWGVISIKGLPYLSSPLLYLWVTGFPNLWNEEIALMFYSQIKSWCWSSLKLISNTRFIFRLFTENIYRKLIKILSTTKLSQWKLVKFPWRTDPI